MTGVIAGAMTSTNRLIVTGKMTISGVSAAMTAIM
jgi:hypothetical protein